MFRLEDSAGVLIPGNSGLIPGWNATVVEALYNYFQNSIKTEANGEWFEFSLPKITIPAGYENGTIRWIQFIITTSPTDSSFITSIRKPQFEKGSVRTNYAETYRPAIQLPSTLDFAGNEVHETGTANFEDFSTVGVTDGLVGYWQLNKDAKDYSGNNYNGTVSGATSYGEYYKFDGTDDYINIPHQVLSTAQIRSSGLTIISVFRQTINHRGNIYSSKPSTGYSDASSGGIGVDSGKARMICWNNGGSYMYATGNTTLTNGQWYIAAGTYNPVDTNISIYLNGALDATPVAIGLFSELSTNNEVQIGKSNHVTSQFHFNGDIAYIKIFNRALTPEEITIEYNTMFNNEVQIHESGVLYAKDIKQY